MRGRELSAEAVAHQAEQLAEYSRRGGSVSRWLESKGFLSGDREAIRKAWMAMDEEQAS